MFLSAVIGWLIGFFILWGVAAALDELFEVKIFSNCFKIVLFVLSVLALIGWARGDKRGR